MKIRLFLLLMFAVIVNISHIHAQIDASKVRCYLTFDKTITDESNNETIITLEEGAL